MTIEDIKAKILPILKRYGVQRAALFGSFVRGEERGSSDIDILIEFKDRENKTLLDLVGLELELEDILNREVDLLTYNSIHPLLRDYILDEQEVFYEERS
ncbi:MAG: nucleotidyltransferase family protein [Methanosarcinales archaeon Met12]|nr:MAG: nucleotidyltransferase family protein [Methanosarcinales archaeon Met12]